MGNIDSVKIIDEILVNSKKHTMDKDLALQNFEYIDNLRKLTTNNFLESIKEKSVSDIKYEFEKRLDEYDKATKLYVEKKNKEKY